MRKAFWCCAGLAVAGAAVAYLSADYACRHPQSLVGRSVVAAYHIGLKCGPIYHAGGVFTAVCQTAQTAVTSEEAADEDEGCCIPDDPQPFVDGAVEPCPANPKVEPEPELDPAQGRLPGKIVIQPDEEPAQLPEIVLEPPGPERFRGYFPNLELPADAEAKVSSFPMPYCTEDEPASVPMPQAVDGEPGFWKRVSSWLTSGSAESSEPPTASNPEQPEHPVCPYCGGRDRMACPYSGKIVPPPAIGDTVETPKPKPAPKKSKKARAPDSSRRIDEILQQQAPKIDTLELRPSDLGKDAMRPIPF